MKTSAEMSECGRYRYTLTRQWDETKPWLVVCGLNPSTADAMKDDPTIRREMNFARDWGFGGLYKVNAYAWRSPYPKDLWLAPDPVGAPRNDDAILDAARLPGALFLAAWGNNITEARNARLVGALFVYGVRVHVLGLTKKRRPVHPLYQPRTARPFLWQ